MRREEGVWGGLEPKILCTKNNPNQYFPFVSFIFSRDEGWVKGGEGVRGGVPPLL